MFLFLHNAIIIQIWDRLMLTSVGERSSPSNRQYVATLTAGVLVGLVLAVGLAITEQLLVDALTVTARQFSLRANGFVGLEDGQDLTRLCKNAISVRPRKAHLLIDYHSRYRTEIHRTSIERP